MFARHAVGAILVSVLAVIPICAQIGTSHSQSYGIEGTVRGSSDKVMENVRVELKFPTGSTINSTFTRGNGEFEFEGLEKGNYIVEVLVNGYEPAIKAVTLANSWYRGLSFTISRPVKVVTTNSGGSTISVHQLSAPRKAQEEFTRGLQLANDKSDYRGSIVQFQRAIKDFPTFYEAYAQEGSCYLSLHELAPAEAALRKSVELSSEKYSDALFMLAGLLSDTNRYSEAESVARRVMELDSTSWQGPYELARALTGLKQVEEAEKDAIKARDSKPDNPPVYLVLANIHILRHDYSALMSDLDTYLKIAPTGPGAEQARKTREQLQDSLQEDQDQSTEPHLASADSGGQGRAHSDAADQEKPGPDDPDSTTLPSLPPPTPSN